MWETIVLNLVSNAFKFTFEGRIEVCLRQIDSTIHLTVRDTGVGMPARMRSRIWCSDRSRDWRTRAADTSRSGRG
jgi:signal transduction histidine kinase